jgi:hypothetical protein
VVPVNQRWAEQGDQSEGDAHLAILFSWVRQMGTFGLEDAHDRTHSTQHVHRVGTLRQQLQDFRQGHRQGSLRSNVLPDLGQLLCSGQRLEEQQMDDLFEDAVLRQIFD